MFKKVFTINLTVAASFYGVMAIAWAQVVISVFGYFVNTHYTKVFLGYGGWKQLGDLAVNFAAVIPMAIAVYFVNDMMQASPFFKLIVASIIGGGVYLLTCRLLCADLLDQCLSMAGLRKHSAQV